MIRITLEDWMCLNGCSRVINSYWLDKCKFPKGIGKATFNALLERGVAEGEAYSEKRRSLRQEYCKLVEFGKILPLSTLENNICRCTGNPELESVKASKRMLWKQIQKLPNNKLKCSIDIDNLYNVFGSNLKYCFLDKETGTLIYDGKVIYEKGECCLINSCDDDSLCLFGHTNHGTISLTYREMEVSLMGDSIEKARKLIENSLSA